MYATCVVVANATFGGLARYTVLENPDDRQRRQPTNLCHSGKSVEVVVLLRIKLGLEPILEMLRRTV